MMDRHKILKIEQLDHDRLVLWLEGKPFTKKTEWDEEAQKVIYTDIDDWNFCCEAWKLEEAFKRSLPDIDLYKELFEKGVDFYVGFSVSLDDEDDVNLVFQGI